MVRCLHVRVRGVNSSESAFPIPIFTVRLQMKWQPSQAKFDSSLFVVR